MGKETNKSNNESQAQAIISKSLARGQYFSVEAMGDKSEKEVTNVDHYQPESIAAMQVEIAG